MDTIKVEEQMQEWFLHFDANIEHFKLIHVDEIDFDKFELKEVKRGVDSNVKTDEQKEGAGKS